MACKASIGGFRRNGVKSDGINSPLKVGFDTEKKRHGVKSGRINMAYCQSEAVSPGSCSASFYQLLSVPADANARDLKSAYRRKALQYHPDVCPPEEKEECSRMFVQVRAAYETLSDPVRRQDYDWRLQNNLDMSESVGKSGVNNSTWEAQVMELIRRSNCRRDYTWGGRMRSRNQHMDSSASAC